MGDASASVGGGVLLLHADARPASTHPLKSLVLKCPELDWEQDTGLWDCDGGGVQLTSGCWWRAWYWSVLALNSLQNAMMLRP